MRTVLVMFLVGCGSGFSGSEAQTTAGSGGGASVAVAASGAGGAEASAAEVGTPASSSVASASTAASSTAASSSSTGGGELTSGQMYKLFCVDKMPMVGIDHCDAMHGNCHCVAGSDPACPFPCGSYKYCCTIWSNPYAFCTLGGGKTWKGVGYQTHEGSGSADVTYCAN